MAMIYVKAKQGRKAFYEGRIIPQDRFIQVTDDPYIRRLIHHWEDLETTDTPPPEDAEAPRSEGGAPHRPAGRATQPPAGAQAPGTGAPKPQN